MSDLIIKKSPILDNIPSINHGFFTNHGGVSSGIYTSLNAGYGSLDPQDNVTQNRKRIALALEAQPENLLSLHQIHSTKVMTIVSASAIWTPDNRPKADGIVTNIKGLAISALAADCAPVLFADPIAGVIGAAHAGWRGALAGITDQTLEAMTAIGATKSNIRVTIGPCISVNNYETGPEFKKTFLEADPDNDQFFHNEHQSKAFFDLKAYLLARLKAQGVTRCMALSDCTYELNGHYFSYRRNTHQNIRDYGRNISAIMLKE
jgi:YfiH family protein